MKEEINFSQFCDRFKKMNRENQFSYDRNNGYFHIRIWKK